MTIGILCCGLGIVAHWLVSLCLFSLTPYLFNVQIDPLVASAKIYLWDDFGYDYCSSCILVLYSR